MKTLFVIMFAILILAGCDDHSGRARSKIKQLKYVIDRKTNLCFAVYARYGTKMGMANVPCSKVEKYLER